MESFTYHSPTRLVFGPGAVEGVGKEAAALGARALIVTGKSHAERTGLLARVTGLLEEEKVSVIHFRGINPNPRAFSVREGVRLCRESNADLVIGLGGGSVMDAAKVIAAGVPYAGDPWDFAPHRQKTCPPPTTSLPTIMVPTLAATASEMNDVAVLTNTDTREKTGIHHKCFYPRVSIMDPELTRSVPQKPTAYGAVDIFSHTAETYLSGKGDTPLQDGMQETIMRIALEMGAIAVADGNDLSARTHLQWASILSHNGWTRLGTGGLFPMHKIEHAVSAYTDLAHGAGLAILMPAYMRVACRTHPEKYVRLAEKVLGIETAGRDPVASALDGIAKLESVIQSMGAPIRLSEVGIGEDLFDCILDHILRLSAGPDGSLPGAPPMDRTALLDVLRTAK